MTRKVFQKLRASNSFRAHCRRRYGEHGINARDSEKNAKKKRATRIAPTQLGSFATEIFSIKSVFWERFRAYLPRMSPTYIEATLTSPPPYKSERYQRYHGWRVTRELRRVEFSKRRQEKEEKREPRPEQSSENSHVRFTSRANFCDVRDILLSYPFLVMRFNTRACAPAYISVLRFRLPRSSRNYKYAIPTYGNFLHGKSFAARQRKWMTFARDAFARAKIARRDWYENVYGMYQQSYVSPQVKISRVADFAL